jgi:Rrf2 family nitric oxide-sensitive transcriptional repressor
MVKLNRKLEYALIALKHLSQTSATDKKLTSAKEISLTYVVPFDVVSRVLQILNQNGIVKSIQGVQGGYHLQKSLEEISLHDLVELIEGPVELVKCLGTEHQCEIKGSCNIISPIQALNHRVTDFYKTIKLSDLVGSAEVR